MSPAHFSVWSAVPTAAVKIACARQLDEDVSGANVTRSGAVLTMPADIQPASSKPFAVVHDADGKVIEALLGTGASAAQNCATNAVVGGPDRVTADAGNLVTGLAGATGERFDHWGSDDAELRGVYDLAGLQIPAGAGSA